MKRKHPCCSRKLIVQKQQPNERKTDAQNQGEFAWEISNFSGQNAKKLYSEAFTVSGCRWRRGMPRTICRCTSRSLILRFCPAILPNRWTAHAVFSLSVIDAQSNRQCSLY